MTLTKLREIAMAASQEICCEVANTNARNNYEYIATFSPAMVLKLLDCVAALQAVKNCIDTDSVKNKTDDGEIEYWVSDQQVQLICDEALAALKGNK